MGRDSCQVSRYELEDDAALEKQHIPLNSPCGAYIQWIKHHVHQSALLRREGRFVAGSVNLRPDEDHNDGGIIELIMGLLEPSGRCEGMNSRWYRTMWLTLEV
jgi:hypothetical protein